MSVIKNKNEKNVVKNKRKSKSVKKTEVKSNKKKNKTFTKGKVMHVGPDGVTDRDTEEWINTEGGDPDFRRKVVEVNEKHGVNLVVLEPGVFDHGVKRVGQKRDGYVVVYDVEKLAEALAEDYLKWNDNPKNEFHVDDYDFDAAYSDAIEWIDFNTARSLSYIREYAPKLVINNENRRETKY